MMMTTNNYFQSSLRRSKKKKKRSRSLQRGEEGQGRQLNKKRQPSRRKKLQKKQRSWRKLLQKRQKSRRKQRPKRQRRRPEATTRPLSSSSWRSSTAGAAKNTKKVYVLDNATYHTSKEIKKYCKEAGIGLLFLPSSSSDLNPIGKSFSNRSGSQYQVLFHYRALLGPHQT